MENMNYQTLSNDQDMSAQIGKLALALSKAQGEMGAALKDSKNPFFNSRYADLAAVWAALREPLAKNELAVVQTTNGDGSNAVIITRLVHSSGEWIKGTLTLKPTKQDPQGIGSAITYGRRYALAAICGVVQEDDDANAASKPVQSAQKTQPTPEAKAPPVTPKVKAKTPKERCGDGIKKLGFDPEQETLLMLAFEGDFETLLKNLTASFKAADKEGAKQSLLALADGLMGVAQ